MRKRPPFILPALCLYHKATLPAIPKSSVAVVMPNALKTRLIVERVIELLPLSNLHIWERFTPTLSPNSS